MAEPETTPAVAVRRTAARRPGAAGCGFPRRRRGRCRSGALWGVAALVVVGRRRVLARRAAAAAPTCAPRSRSGSPTIEAAAHRRGRGAGRELAAELRDAQAKIALLEARLAESQTQQAALEALYRDLAPSRDEIALTEVEQVLLIASQQLQLAGNVPAALAALQLADAKLQRLERPQFARRCAAR